MDRFHNDLSAVREDVGTVRETVGTLREDVGYIRAKIDALPDHENRIRLLEKRWWQFPTSAVVAVMSAVLAHFFK